MLDAILCGAFERLVAQRNLFVASLESQGANGHIRENTFKWFWLKRLCYCTSGESTPNTRMSPFIAPQMSTWCGTRSCKAVLAHSSAGKVGQVEMDIMPITHHKKVENLCTAMWEVCLTPGPQVRLTGLSENTRCEFLRGAHEILARSYILDKEQG